MAIHQGAEGTSEVTHRRKMLHQPSARFSNCPTTSTPGRRASSGKASAAAAIGWSASTKRCHSSTAEGLSDVGWLSRNRRAQRRCAVTFRQQHIPSCDTESSVDLLPRAACSTWARDCCWANGPGRSRARDRIRSGTRCAENRGQPPRADGELPERARCVQPGHTGRHSKDPQCRCRSPPHQPARWSSRSSTGHHCACRRLNVRDRSLLPLCLLALAWLQELFDQAFVRRWMEPADGTGICRWWRVLTAPFSHAGWSPTAWPFCLWSWLVSNSRWRSCLCSWLVYGLLGG